LKTLVLWNCTCKQ